MTDQYSNITVADIAHIERVITAALRGQKALPAIAALLNVAQEIAGDLGAPGERLLERLLCGLLHNGDLH